MRVYWEIFVYISFINGGGVVHNLPTVRRRHVPHGTSSILCPHLFGPPSHIHVGKGQGHEGPWKNEILWLSACWCNDCVCVFWWLSSRVSCPSSVWEFGDKSHFSGFVALLACLPSGEIRCLKDRFPILRLDLLHKQKLYLQCPRQGFYPQNNVEANQILLFLNW